MKCVEHHRPIIFYCQHCKGLLSEDEIKEIYPSKQATMYFKDISDPPHFWEGKDYYAMKSVVDMPNLPQFIYNMHCPILNRIALIEQRQTVLF